MRILLYDNYDSFTYNLVHLLEAVDPAVEVEVMLNDDPDLERWRQFDRVVLSPGPGLPQESGHLMEFISITEGRIPMLGVCLGLQALTVHFGGTLKNLHRVLHGISVPTFLTDTPDPLFNGIENTFDTGRYHSWVADPVTFPAELAVTATDADGEVIAFRHRKKPLWAVQFHPESILTPQGPKILENWVKSC